MDADIREDLKGVAKLVQAVGRQLISTKSDVESLTTMSKCLADAKIVLDTYIQIQKNRYTE